MKLAIFHVLMVIMLFFLYEIPHSFASIRCPEAPRQLGDDIIIEARGRIKTLGRLTDADLQGKVVSVTKDFFKEYPKAEKIVIAQQEVKPHVTSKLTKRGWFYLVNETTSKIRNIDSEVFAVLYVDGLALPGNIFTIPAESPGVLYRVTPSSDIFSIELEPIRKTLLSTIDEISTKIGKSKNEINIRQFTCARIEYDDEYGNHYRHFLSLRVFSEWQLRTQDMYENKNFFDDCKNDYERYKKHQAHFLEFWNDGTKRNMLAEKILSNLR